jgi:hypothetical protein
MKSSRFLISKSIRSCHVIYCSIIFILFAISMVPEFAQASDLTVGNYELVSSKRITRTVWEYSYRASIANSGGIDATNVTATSTSTVPGITVKSGSLTFGQVPAGATVKSSDTITINVNRLYTLAGSDLSWSIDYTLVTPNGDTATFAPNTKPLGSDTAASLASVSSDGARLVFSTMTPQIKSLKAGDVIISGPIDAAPRGILRKVISLLIQADGTVEVMTEPATLTDAFKELHIKVTKTTSSMLPAEFKIAYKKSAKEPELAFVASASIGSDISFGLSGDYDLASAGDYQFTPDVDDFQIDISGLTLQYLKLVLSGSQTLSLNEDLKVKRALSLSPEIDLIPFPVFLGFIPTPFPLLVLTVDFMPSFGVDISAESALDINFGFSASDNFTLGFEYRHGDGFSGIHSFDYSFSPYFAVSNDVSFSFEPYLRGKLGFGVNGIDGPYFDVRPYGRIEKVVLPQPKDLELGWGFSVNVGGELEVFGRELLGINLELCKPYWAISASAIRPTAPVLIPPTNNPPGVYLNPKNVEFRWQPSVDPNGDSLQYCVVINEDSTPTDIPIYNGCDQGIFLSDTHLPPMTLIPGKTYWWAVWAKDSNGNWSPASSWASFTTAALYKVSGKVTSNGVALEGVTVNLEGVGATATDAAGNYQFIDVLEGTYNISFAKAGYTLTPRSKRLLLWEVILF